MKACNKAENVNKANAGNGTIYGANINNTAKNKSSPLILPKSLNDMK